MKIGPPCSKSAWCTAMESSLNKQANVGKGLSTVMVASKTTGPRLLGIRYAKSSSDPGIMLNSCPWCGANLENLR